MNHPFKEIAVMHGNKIAAFAGATLVIFFCLCSSLLYAANLDQYFDDEDVQNTQVAPTVHDPLEPMNRFFFNFNDKLYFWAIKPVSTVYAKVIPVDLRIAIRNAFDNLLAPVRIVNNFLQGKVRNSGTELVRFVINSTAGIGGLADVAKNDFHIEEKDEDLGQTLGTYGAGGGAYFCWPFIGPSNFRDTIGLVGDGFITPIYYLTGGNFYSAAGIKAGERVNDVSLRLGDYERFKAAAIDPYISMRQAYRQSREKEIKDALQSSPEEGMKN